MRSNILMHALLLAALAVPAAAEDEPPRDVPTAPAGPVVDGRLDDHVWRDARVIDDFVARTPVDGAPPSMRTEVRLLCTARALYLALDARDPQPATLRATSMRRDDFAIVGDDQFVIALDSFRDRRSGFWFSTNPLGVRVDGQFADEGARFDDNWNGVWEVAARRGAEGWTAEIEIPWATLRFREGADVVMGINLYRRIPRTGERLFAPAIPLVYPNGTMNVSAARPYRFRGIEGGSRLDVRPFATASVERFPGRGEQQDLDGGLFVRAPLSSAFTLAGTLRADFSEVEADQPQLNLTRVPLFLPEKRDFFLDGAGIFAFGVPGEAELFFSRTIGLARDESGHAIPTPIDWGVKGTGRTGAIEAGVLSGSTGPVANTPGERFGVARVRATLAGRSTAGAFWSHRGGGDARDRATYGLDASHFLPHEIRLQGFAARDRRSGRDRDAWFASVGRGGERATFTLSALDLATDFRPAVGQVARPGTRRLRADGTLPWFAGRESRLDRWVPGAAWTRYDEAGGGFSERGVISLAGLWRSGHSIRIEGIRERERITAPYPIWRAVQVAAGAYDRWEGGLVAATDAVRPLQGELALRAGGFYGGRHRFVRLAGQWYPDRHFFLEPALSVDDVDFPGGRFTAWVVHARLGLTASPALRMDVLGQYEREREGAGLGVRVRYDFREGAQWVGAWDAIELREPGAARARSERGAFKLSYLFLF